jgi:hypothetical protein
MRPNNAGTVRRNVAVVRRGSRTPTAGSTAIAARATIATKRDQTERPRIVMCRGVIGLMATENPKIA